MTLTSTPINLACKPGVGSLAVSWGVSTTTNLGGWLLHWRPRSSTPLPWSTVQLASSVRAYLITGLQSETYEVQVRVLLSGGSETKTAMPLATGAATIPADIPFTA